LTGSRTTVPKAGDGIVEAIRTLRVTRRGAVKARTATINQLKALLVTAPAEIREPLAGLTTAVLIPACLALAPTGPVADPAQAVRLVLRRLARRYQFLSTEIRLADAELRALVGTAAPGMLTRLGVGVEVTGQLLTTVGDNPSGCGRRPRSPTSAGSPPSRPAAARPVGIGSTAAGTGRRTTRSTPSCSLDYGSTGVPALTPPAAPPKV
jgi:transposase